MRRDMKVEIREAKPSDAECIHEMIKELCTYEKVSLSEVQTTPEDLINDGLKNNGIFKCLVAEVSTYPLVDDKNDESGNDATEKKVVGYALYYFGYSTWKGKLMYLEDVYVKREYRGNGIGTRFFKRLGEIALDTKCCRIAFVCLDWNEPSKEFYARIGADEQPEWRMFYFTNERLQSFVSQ